MADPSRSWVAKWQRIDGYVKGIYATKVMGQLPEEVITSLEEEYRIRYIPYVTYYLSAKASEGRTMAGRNRRRRRRRRRAVMSIYICVRVYVHLC